MRTTVDLDDDVLGAARALAAAANQSMGRVLSQLARRGLAPRRSGARKRFAVFPVSQRASPLTASQVRRAAEED